MPLTIDYTSLFTGEQIDTFIKYHITDNNILYIGAYITELIISENIKITEVDNITIDDLIIIIDPINLDNEHWALFIADEMSPYILGPYMNSSYRD